MSIPVSIDPMGTLGYNPARLTGAVNVGQLDGLTSTDTPRLKIVAVFDLDLLYTPTVWSRIFEIYSQGGDRNRFFCVYNVARGGWLIENNTGVSVDHVIDNGEHTLMMTGDSIALDGLQLHSGHGPAVRGIPFNVQFGSADGYPHVVWHRLDFYVDNVLTHAFVPVRLGVKVGMKDKTTGIVYLPS